MKYLYAIALLANASLLVSCTDSPMEDERGPSVAINFQDTSPQTSVSSEDEELEADDNCAVVPNRSRFAQTLNVSANDPGGLAAIGVRVTSGELELVSIAPESAVASGWRWSGITFLEAGIPAPSIEGEVYVSSLATVELTSPDFPISVRGFARDLAGNYTETQQFDLVSEIDARTCRGN